MRRSGPLRRSGGLKRTGPLARKSAPKRTPIKRRPKPSRTDPVDAAHWFCLVALDDRGRPRPCFNCGKITHRVQAHHVLTQQIIRNRYPRDYERLRWDVRNGVPICPDDCHEPHTGGWRRLSRSKLPAPAIEFAAELGLEHRLDPPEYAP